MQSKDVQHNIIVDPLLYSRPFCKAALEQAEQQKAAAETEFADNVEKKTNAGQKIEALGEQATVREEAAKAAAEVLNKTAAVDKAKAAVAAAQQALQLNSSSPALNATLNAAQACCLFSSACYALLNVAIRSTTRTLIRPNVLPRCRSLCSVDRVMFPSR